MRLCYRGCITGTSQSHFLLIWFRRNARGSLCAMRHSRILLLYGAALFKSIFCHTDSAVRYSGNSFLGLSSRFFHAGFRRLIYRSRNCYHRYIQWENGNRNCGSGEEHPPKGGEAVRQERFICITLRPLSFPVLLPMLRSANNEKKRSLPLKEAALFFVASYGRAAPVRP